MNTFSSFSSNVDVVLKWNLCRCWCWCWYWCRWHSIVLNISNLISICNGHVKNELNIGWKSKTEEKCIKIAKSCFTSFQIRFLIFNVEQEKDEPWNGCAADKNRKRKYYKIYSNIMNVNNVHLFVVYSYV